MDCLKVSLVRDWAEFCEESVGRLEEIYFKINDSQDM